MPETTPKVDADGKRMLEERPRHEDLVMDLRVAEKIVGDAIFDGCDEDDSAPMLIAIKLDQINETLIRVATALETHTLRAQEHGTLHNQLADTFNEHVFKYHTPETK